MLTVLGLWEGDLAASWSGWARRRTGQGHHRWVLCRRRRHRLAQPRWGWSGDDAWGCASRRGLRRGRRAVVFFWVRALQAPSSLVLLLSVGPLLGIYFSAGDGHGVLVFSFANRQKKEGRDAMMGPGICRGRAFACRRHFQKMAQASDIPGCRRGLSSTTWSLGRHHGHGKKLSLPPRFRDSTHQPAPSFLTRQNKSHKNITKTQNQNEPQSLGLAQHFQAHLTAVPLPPPRNGWHVQRPAYPSGPALFQTRQIRRH